MTHLCSINPFGDGLLGVSHGLQLASSISHLASKHVEPLGDLLCLLHGGWGCALTSGVDRENTWIP